MTNIFADISSFIDSQIKKFLLNEILSDDATYI